MHEVGLTKNILRTALDQAQKENAKKILKVKIRVGKLQGVSQEAIETIFEIFSKGTIAEGSAIEIETVDVTCYCKNCQKEFAASDYINECPECHQSNTEIKHGMEFDFTEMEVS